MIDSDGFDSVLQADAVHNREAAAIDNSAVAIFVFRMESIVYEMRCHFPALVCVSHIDST
ncbi:hypothetical protein [Nocardia transvalensis]|uniref:hypothetical protein n=1 Tax=Nocardia transvalensis TaxID=37333 RepID=UPI001E3D61A4|nr:hypothetical protein [Nocardia transvalensis]